MMMRLLTAVLGLLVCPACISAQQQQFDAEARLAEYAKKNPPSEADLHRGSCVVSNGNDTKVGPLNAINNPALLWTGNTLYYEFQGPFSEEQKNKVRRATAEIMRNTGGCVRLIESNRAYNRVAIRKCGNACNSYVGMIGGQQQMCMADWCVNEHGSVMHEFLHALGFQHEHQRPDRDSYIYVNYGNIQQRYRFAFRKFSTDQVDMLNPYEYGSLMHYGAYSSFAINQRQPVMIPRQNGAKIGNRAYMTRSDIERVQILYGCRYARDSHFFKHLDGLI